ncbi:nucleophile aminohydrolase [Infundibulicybe gibba]|nr:nucleophile aminohydrolase [Infundibulicybe gibba]
MTTKRFIVVHGGAGVHGRFSEKEVKHALRLQALESDTSALAMVESAIVTLEDDPHLNAGYGSNLTLDGRVECDAAIMDGSSGGFGSAGAVAGVKNPITLARVVLEHARTCDALGRIPPMTLVSQGALEFAATYRDVERVSPKSLVTPEATKRWITWKEQLVNLGQAAGHGGPGLRDIQDTVGAVSLHGADGVAAGVSSGGLLLKHAGRIGEACVYGAGCWAQGPSETRAEMACSISGAGEHIIRAALARRLGDAFGRRGVSGDEIDPHHVLEDVLVNDFWRPCRQRGELTPSVGVVLLTKEADDEGECVWRSYYSLRLALLI